MVKYYISMKGNFNESNFQTKFGRWLRGNKNNETYELKIVKDGKFKFKQVKDHQIDGLLKSIEGIYIKIPDTASKSGGCNKKPFDCLWIIASQAWVAVMFYKYREKQYFYRIPICNFLELKDTWRKKSIGEKEFSEVEGVEKFSLDR
jgi:hypothetical protein